VVPSTRCAGELDHLTRQGYRNWRRSIERGTLLGVTASALPTSPDDDIHWLSTADAADRLGITPRTLYRFIDEGQVSAYRFGRVIRLKAADVDQFIDNCRIEPGTLEHLYPDSGTDTSTTE